MNNTETNQQAEINQLEQEIDMHYEQIQTVALPDTNEKNTKDSTPSRESPKTSTNPWPSLTPTKNDQHDQPQNRKKTPIQNMGPQNLEPLKKQRNKQTPIKHAHIQQIDKTQKPKPSEKNINNQKELSKPDIQKNTLENKGKTENNATKDSTNSTERRSRSVEKTPSLSRKLSGLVAQSIERARSSSAARKRNKPDDFSGESPESKQTRD